VQAVVVLPVKEAVDGGGEALAGLDLHPVAAATEDVHLTVVDELVEAQRGLQRDDTVIPAVDDQRLLRDMSDAVVRQGQRLCGALAGRGEHLGVGLRDSGSDGCLVT
jgi:hypothetical protein